MNVTTYAYQIEFQGITTFGAFKVSYPGSSRQVLNKIETQLSQLKSILQQRGLEFKITQTIEASNLNLKIDSTKEVPLLDHQNLSTHIQTVVAKKFDLPISQSELNERPDQ